MQSSKVKISQKDFDEIYEIEGITEETLEVPKEDTTPEFLTEEEQILNDEYLKDYPTPKEEQDGN